VLAEFRGQKYVEFDEICPIIAILSHYNGGTIGLARGLKRSKFVIRLLSKYRNSGVEVISCI
jgi:hypothetical protein